MNVLTKNTLAYRIEIKKITLQNFGLPNVIETKITTVRLATDRRTTAGPAQRSCATLHLHGVVLKLWHKKIRKLVCEAQRTSLAMRMLASLMPDFLGIEVLQSLQDLRYIRCDNGLWKYPIFVCLDELRQRALLHVLQNDEEMASSLVRANVFDDIFMIQILREIFFGHRIL